ncbi:helix-turn-helix domain-containing protein [Larkinella terrae]|uniref:Helix-turn-helix domain-containing protein n=1 Tax=Larkinella terrae TaxID=2025311 RepID=A0A7K0EKV2_9BACT|nr:helix-turn-helix domain-containing protein [Larkinella terrae]MRS62126.1 helix-turn-helix domain-containing protein [Larkinella terrae]
MNVIVRNPPESLRLFVDKLWHFSADQLEQQDVCLPVLQYELMFNFSDHFSVSDPTNVPIIQDEENWISGLFTRPQRAATSGRHETFGVFLKPWALQSLTGIPASELTNQLVSGTTVFRQSMKTLNDRLRESKDGHAKIKLIEAFLTTHLSDKDIPAYLIYAANCLQHSVWHDGMIRNLAQELRISVKSLTVAFKKHIGVSPGRFLHLRLLNDVVSDLARNPQQSLTELAHNHRFFDQAHLNHLFKSLAHLTPGEYRKQVLAGKVDPATPCYLNSNE